MQHDLDQKLDALKAAPLDRRLDGLADDAAARIADLAANAQTWALRAAAVALVTMTGAMIGASGTAAAEEEQASPFDAWSQLAPSTLLEPAE